MGRGEEGSGIQVLMKIRILPSAKRDLNAGFEFYEKQEAGVGSYFTDCLSSDISSLKLFAGSHRKRGDLHRFTSKRFPYWIYYRLEGETAYIVAVLDARRDPDFIERRERIERRDSSS